MGFDIVGHSPASLKGEYFRNNVWWWRPLQTLIALKCRDILSPADLQGLNFNDGYLIEGDKATQIAARLVAIALNQSDLDEAYDEVMAILPPGYYEKCWSRENILDFAEFAQNSGGFVVC